MSERFWDEGIEKVPLQVMGSLGLNTVEKMTRSRIILFGFGIGVSVVKGLLPHILRRTDVTEVTVMTGNRNESEALYKDYLESIAGQDTRLKVHMVLSQPVDQSYPLKGYIHDHIEDVNFTDASIYICGTKRAAESLKELVESGNSKPREFLLEVFD